MDERLSFGYWIRRRRKSLDLTQEELARQANCSLGAIRKLEADERRPSVEMAERLALVLKLPVEQRAAFLKVARSERSVDDLAAPTEDVVIMPRPIAINHTTFPVAVTALIGRTAEVAAVRTTLEQPGVRLVTLTGPGGTGKTRLALAAAAEMRDTFADGAFFIDLAPIREPELVLVTIAATLGVAERRERSSLSTVQEALRDRHLLLILDNVEQVVSVAPQLSELMRSAPRVTLLVTSRVVLGMYGEHVVTVPPLELPDPQRLAPLAELREVEAIHLFVERAVAASSRFALSEANAQAIVDICCRLDGLPLALELAAARIRVISPAELLSHLQQRLPVLTGGARDMPARQQTLRATVDWSYQLLAPAEQELFRRLAVFVGGWSLPAAVALADGDLPMEVLDRLQVLLDSSLILKTDSPDGTSHFRMYETIQEYALEQLEMSGEAAEVRGLHAAYFLELAETAAAELAIPARNTWLAQLERELDNLRAVFVWSETQLDGAETMLRLATALGEFWEGHLGEGVDWMQRALMRSAHPPIDVRRSGSRLMRLRARALAVASHLAMLWWGDPAQARSAADESIILYEALGDTAGLAFALVNAGYIESRYDVATAIPLLERSLALNRALGDDVNTCCVLLNLGFVARTTGDYGQSEVFYSEALELARALNDQQWTAGVLEKLGTLALHQQDPHRAARMLEECISVLRGLQLSTPTWDLAWALIHLAEARRVMGSTADGLGGATRNDTKIRGLWEEGLVMLRALDARWITATALLEIGEMVFEQGDDERASALLRESVAEFHTNDSVEELGRALDAMAALWAQSGCDGVRERAVCLWSAATKWHQNRIRLSPIRRSRYERTYAAVRAQMSEAAFARAWADGQRLTQEHAIAYALGELGPEYAWQREQIPLANSNLHD